MSRAIRLSQDDDSPYDSTVLRAALTLGFKFLLRGSEFLFRDSEGWDLTKVLRGVDLEFRAKGVRQPVPLRDPAAIDEVVLYQRAAKGDQFNQGTVRNHFRSHDGDVLCVVQALVSLATLAPDRWLAGANCPLLVRSNGLPVRRSEIRDLLRKAANTLGLPVNDFTVHSLRSGGASAIFAATGDEQLVRRFGRWASEAYRGYIWETHGLSRGLSAKMSSAQWDLHAGLDSQRLADLPDTTGA